MKPFLLVVAYGWSLERCFAAGTVATRKILIGTHDQVGTMAQKHFLSLGKNTYADYAGAPTSDG